MEQLKQMIMERAGISEDQANKAVDAVKEFAQQSPGELSSLMPSGAQGVADRIGGLGS